MAGAVADGTLHRSKDESGQPRRHQLPGWSVVCEMINHESGGGEFGRLWIERRSASMRIRTQYYQGPTFSKEYKTPISLIQMAVNFGSNTKPSGNEGVNFLSGENPPRMR